ncbi:MAG: ABC transporter ATP-binding protein [Firmicutes bacterium]|nr:ABC transporter ATP-binding protein [Bacillota bacterium]
MNPGRRGMNSSEKAKDFKKSMFNLISYCKPYLIPILAAVVLAMVSAILSIIGPDKLKDITNLITEGLMLGINMNEIKKVAITLIIIYVTSAIFGYVQHYIMAVVTNKFSKQLRKEITEKINNMPLKYFDKNSYGDILSRVTNDVDTLSQTLNQSLGTLVSAITLLIGSVFMMIITNGIMAITAMVSSIIGFVFLFVIIARSQKYFGLLQKEIGELNGHIEEMYSGHNVVRVYNGTKIANLEFDEINNRLSDNVRKSQFLSGLMHPIMGFIGNFGYVSVCIVGALLTMNNVIDFGVIVAFMLYVRLFTQPLSQIAQALSSLQSCAASSERVFEFLDEEEMSNENSFTKKLLRNEVKGEIEFKHVKFGYDKNKIIIKDFNVSVKPGQKIAIVGPTGAGKTTMVNLLMKFYEINDGDILIDGISTKELTRKNIHDLFIMVLQDTWVFEGTIKENIKYNKKNISDDRVKEVCKIVGLHHFIKTLPNGYDTILTDNDSLSSGQKQLLTIARGMVEDAPFLILDEATSSVDTRTEELVQKAMDKLTEGRTSFIIAHRLSTIKNADLILLMQDGNIAEQGSHKELLKLNEKYAELYNSQFEKMES